MTQRYLRLRLAAGLAASLVLAPLTAFTVPASAENSPRPMDTNGAPARETPLKYASPTDSEKELNFLHINDFHGRIDNNTVKFAGTVEKLKAGSPKGATALLSGGDDLSASLYASAVQDDQPTIDVHNALGMTAATVGNHEFDKGYQDLVNRIQRKNGTPNANWTYLGANVYKKGTTESALPEYKIVTLNGVRVAVIGAVTKDTPALVDPSKVTEVDFGDPVAAVSRVADKLKAKGEADVIVAEYHEGARAGTREGATLEQQVAAGGAFAGIVTKTSPAVNVIFTGHTHKEYAWRGPVPGQPGKTRPILQAGNYGQYVGQVQLFINPQTKTITRYQVANHLRLKVGDAQLVKEYPAVATVKDIVDKALANAKKEGSKRLGKITKNITTAFKNNVRDDRSSESTLGNLVADALKATLASSDRGGAEIAVVQPGAMRADLMYDNPEGKGVVTVAQANSVLPFANNLMTTTLTGAQLKTMLEQQWQTNAQGNPITSRPFVALGVSKNVSFTYDPERAMGDRVTSIVVNGTPVDPQRGYRVGTFSFLAAGGDNFRVFKEGKDTHNSRVLDRDGWFEYIRGNSPLSPDFGRRGLSLSGAPTTVEPGQQVTVKLNKVDLTSLDVPASKTVSVRYEPSGVGDNKGWMLPATAQPSALGSFPVHQGEATISFTVPAELNGGHFAISTDRGTTARLPIQVPVTATPAPQPTGGPNTSGESSTDGASIVVGPPPTPGNDSTRKTADRNTGDLARTGAEVVPLGLGVLALLGTGAAILIASRKVSTRL